ncbi:MAG: Rrf2 family transcriptional regulator [Planctomycetes bacterium]|nr:Rrf2 family transcriptional regulator [Planctomycetota bacterium]MBI3836199.1 Rrf2 family transcriptional regulator [Planctomycetota bacterium]
MLALTKKTDYALIALTHLAKKSGELINARGLAAASRIPLPMLTNILKVLAHEGIVGSERGSSGGYVLKRKPSSVNLHELISAVEGPFHFVQCFMAAERSNLEGEGCELEHSCPIRTPALRIQGRLEEFLKSVTLAELLEGNPQRGEVSVRMNLLHG